MGRNYHAITFFFEKMFVLRRPGVAIFADIIKNFTMLITIILKDSKKLEEVEIMYLNGIYICIS